MVHGGRREALAVTAVLLLGAAGCGGSTAAAGPRRSAAPTVPSTGTSSTRAPAGSTPLGVGSSASGLPALNGTGTATPRPFRPRAGSVDAAGSTDPKALINLVYDTWMTDLSGLFANLTQPWVTAISDIATPAMTTAAQRSASALQQAHDHALGTLVDSRRVVTVKGATAILTDCLDELHWYVVENANGKPDPSVTRGYFVGTADFVLTRGQWYVSSWNSHPQRCAP